MVETESFKDGTFLYPRHVVKGAEVGTIRFERAATIFDSDFYDWVSHAIYGEKPLARVSRPSFRKNILVVHFTRINPLINTSASSIVAGLVATATTAIPQLGVAAATVATAVGALIGPFEFAARLPGRAWMLHNSIPIRYKAGSDFNALSPGVSLMELDVQPEYVSEYSFGIKP